MIRRRLRARPRRFVGFRVIIFSLGMMFVLATTTTIQTIGIAFSALTEIGATINHMLGTTPKLKKQEEENG